METAVPLCIEKSGSSVLVASSNNLFREQVQGTLGAHWSVEEAHGGAEALAKLDAGRHDALLVDSWLADLDVPELVRMVRVQCPQMVVFTVDPETGKPRSPSAASRSPRMRELFRILQGAQGVFSESGIAMDLPDSSREDSDPRCEPLPGMIGAASEIRRVYRMARLVAPRKTTALITGDTGTGKELVARAIHQLSPRASHPFVVVNCAAIPEALLEAELFGHMKGAFTGAVQNRLGLVQAASNGTLFLDEIGDTPLSLQAKLLRFLQEGEVQRLGAGGASRVDVRVVAATNTNLEKLVREGRFRQDLYYRLAVFPIDLPRLRERPEDIPVLAEDFLAKLCGEAGIGVKSIPQGVLDRLKTCAWPGNIRELQHLVERAFILSENRSELCLEDFPALITLQ